MPYPFDQIFAADPDNTEMVASNVGVLIFAPGDETKTPLPLTTLTGIPLANPVPVNDKGFGSAFMADLDQVAWEGGGYTGLFASYRGMKDEAVAARMAAEMAAAEVTKPADQAVDEGIKRADLPKQIAAGVAAQPTVAAAAAAAVDANPKIAELENSVVFNGDARLLRADETETDLGFAVTDRHDRVIFTPAPERPTEIPAYPTPDWAHWGDSMTDDAVTGADSWVTRFAGITGRDHYNGGWYSQMSAQIAARQGGLPAKVTVSGGVIPSNGAVHITATPKPVLPSSTRYVEGVLGGVPGRIQEATSGAVTFTRDAAGSATPVQAGTFFYPTASRVGAGRHITIWVGRNDVYTTPPELVVAAVRQMIDFLTPRVKRALVLEVPPAEGSSATHASVLGINNALRAAFPAEWAPVSSWLRTPAAATAAGITFTDDDQSDIAGGLTPRSFRSDGVHLNANGCRAVAKFIETEAVRRGWL